MTEPIAAPISPEAVIERLKHLPPRNGLPFSNDDNRKIALALRGLLMDLGIYNFHDIGLALTFLNRPNPKTHKPQGDSHVSRNNQRSRNSNAPSTGGPEQLPNQ